MIFLPCLHVPEVERASCPEFHRMPAAPPHPYAARQQVEETPQNPELRREVPPLPAADPLDGSKRPGGFGFYLDLLAVHKSGAGRPELGIALWPDWSAARSHFPPPFSVI